MRTRPLKPVTTALTRERRAHIRLPIRAAVSLTSLDETVWGYVRDLNTGGMYMESRAQFPPDTEVLLDALFPEGHAGTHFQTRAWVAWRDRHGMGIQFERTAPEKLLPVLRAVEKFSGPDA